MVADQVAKKQSEANLPSEQLNNTDLPIGTCPQGHRLMALGTSRDDGWSCSNRCEPGGCLSGITGYSQTYGMNRFRCDLCVYDLCEKCYAAKQTSASQSTLQVSNHLESEVSATSGEAPPAVPSAMLQGSAAGAASPMRALCAMPVPSTAAVESARTPWLFQDGPSSGVSAVAEVSKAVETEWSPHLAFRLEGGDEAVSQLAGQVRHLDVEIVASVTRAVEMLNAGSVDCPDDMCIVYSNSNRGYYLLYRRGKREVALARLGVPEQHLYTGLVLTVGGYRCKVTEALGTGSFGTVWAADCLEGGLGCEVAIKEILCSSSSELALAAFEGKILEMIQGHARACGSSSRPNADRNTNALDGRDPLDRIPDLVGTDTHSCGSEQWRVRLAMTRVPGISLDRFLEVRRSCYGSSGSSGIVPVQQQGTQRFVEACSLARDLILQLAPTFEHISKLSYHRDVNSHNILVDGDVSSPVFGLVDFGLAVDLTRWQGPVGPQSWHLVDIGGDCRYWPMSAWLQFECGWQELSKYPPLSIEYQTQLDFHALGITALQIVAALSPPASEDDTNSLAPQFMSLQIAWDQYWSNVTHFWQRLLDVFRTGGDQTALKMKCINDGVHNTVGADLAALRAAIRDAYNACNTAGPEANLRQFCPLFAALLELVSAGGTVGFRENQRPPDWQGVYQLVAASESCMNIQGMQTEMTHAVPELHSQPRFLTPFSQRSTMISA
mmetsp:Transcript_114110/g.227078  ORF Transcript_114110/g.227078 Transcript_114110/m.227078 type:complete len:722 (+) Transcript_114110:196-2361(+)